MRHEKDCRPKTRAAACSTRKFRRQSERAEQAIRTGPERLVKFSIPQLYVPIAQQTLKARGRPVLVMIRISRIPPAVKVLSEVIESSVVIGGINCLLTAV